MKKYAIIHKDDVLSQDISSQLKRAFQGFMEYDEEHPELVISVGGDGTMLYCVHKYMNQLEEVAFIGIHTGTLGFLTDYQKDEIDLFVQDIKNNEYRIYNRRLLDIKTNKGHYMALNELRIDNNIRSQVIDVDINDEHLETFRGNGLCVCTASGSTAYNKSLGGSVVCSGAGIMQLSEIAGIHHNAYRSLGSSLILDSTHHIHFHSNDFSGSVMGVDHLVYDLEDVEYIDVKISQTRARFAQLKRVSLFERLRRAFLT